MDNQKINNNFYIFSDIDGTLNSLDWVRATHCALIANNDAFLASRNNDPKYKKYLQKMLEKHPIWKAYFDSGAYNAKKFMREISPYNVAPLESFIQEMSKTTNVNLIISSSAWKGKLDIETIPALISAGLTSAQTAQINVDRTPSSATGNKSEEIAEYLSSINNPANYLIIDDETKDLREHFDKSHIITTDGENFGLMQADLANWKNQNLEKVILDIKSNRNPKNSSIEFIK